MYAPCLAPASSENRGSTARGQEALESKLRSLQAVYTDCKLILDRCKRSAEANAEYQEGLRRQSQATVSSIFASAVRPVTALNNADILALKFSIADVSAQGTSPTIECQGRQNQIFDLDQNFG